MNPTYTANIPKSIAPKNRPCLLYWGMNSSKAINSSMIGIDGANKNAVNLKYGDNERVVSKLRRSINLLMAV